MEELTITESAEKYLDELLGSQEKDTVGIKIFVSEPGTPRAETCIAYAKEDESLDDYLLIEELNFSLLLEKSSLDFIKDAIDALQRSSEVPSSTSNLIIDGYFDDWNSVEKYPDNDWNEYQNSPLITENPNVDIENYKGISDEINSFFYLKVYGEMLGGSIVPMKHAKQMPVDSYVPSTGLNTVTPISEPSNLPEKNGEDTIYIFLDTNTSDYFGFEVNDTFHADN